MFEVFMQINSFKAEPRLEAEDLGLIAVQNLLHSSVLIINCGEFFFQVIPGA